MWNFLLLNSNGGKRVCVTSLDNRCTRSSEALQHLIHLFTTQPQSHTKQCKEFDSFRSRFLFFQIHSAKQSPHLKRAEKMMLKNKNTVKKYQGKELFPICWTLNNGSTTNQKQSMHGSQCILLISYGKWNEIGPTSENWILLWTVLKTS